MADQVTTDSGSRSLLAQAQSTTDGHLDRCGKALFFLDRSGHGLEIGPSYSPILPKKSGSRIETLDHASRDELVAKYRSYGLSEDKISLIEDVDYLWAGGSLADAVGGAGKFDFVIAAHVIEHSVDLIGFLQDCNRLLSEAGRVSLVVPDKRFCFDRFKPLASLGAVVDAHLRPTRFHTSGPLLDHQAYACSREDAIAWGPTSVGALHLQDPVIEQGTRVIADGLAQDEYHDVHRWMFTPASFSLLINDLRLLGYHSMVEVGSFETDGFEFFVTLEKSQGNWPAPVDRLQLLRRIERELASPVLGESGGVDVHEAAPVDPRISALQQQLAAVYASKSWRVTRPLRALSRFHRPRVS